MNNDMVSLDDYIESWGSCMRAIALEEIQVRKMLEEIDRASRSGPGARIFVAGNGGSAAIASHFVVDAHKLTGAHCVCLTDNAALLTAMANDNWEAWVGAYKHVLRSHAPKYDDLVIAISSSGKSSNIVSLVEYAANEDMRIVTLTGFDDDNPVMKATGTWAHGVANVHVASHNYGVVEDCHQALLHWACQMINRRMK
jgi:D-sedoheptulose 7-phosphate isomerase